MSAKTPYLIQFPAGSGDAVTQLDTTGNRWPQPFEDLIIDGQDSALQMVTDQVPEADDVNERPFSPGGLDENNGQSYVGTRTFTKGDRFKDTQKGDTTLYFLEAGAAANAARYRVGALLRIASDDSEGPNAAGQMPYPNAPCKLQYAFVQSVNIDANSLTIDQPLKHTHTNDVRDYATDWGGTGLPRITSLNRTPADGGQGFTAKKYLEIRNFTFKRPTNNGIGYLITPAYELVIEGCDIGIYIQPSQCNKVTWRNLILRLGGEMDKELGEGYFYTGEVFGPLTNGRWQRLRVEDYKFRINYSPAGTVQEYFACTFTAGVLTENGQQITAYGSIHSQPGHKPVDKFALADGQTFVTAAGNTAAGHIDYAPHDFYVVEVADESSDLLLPGALTPGSVPKGQDFYRQTCVGMAISNVSGTKKGYFTRRFWVESTKRWHYQGTFPRFEVGEKLVYSHVRNLLPGKGHTVDSKPLFPPHSRRWQGNTGVAGTYNCDLTNADLPVGSPTAQVPFFAMVPRVRVNVLVAQAGGTLDLNNYPMATMPDGSTSRRICRIDLSQTGTRSFTASAATGTKGSDSYDLSALGWVEALDCFRPVAGGQVTVQLDWTTTETPLD